MKDLLLVIDMQHVYEPGQPWACPKIMDACTNIIKLLESGRADQVIFTRFDAAEDPAGAWADYNREYADINADPDMARIIAPLEELSKQHTVCSKHTYSSFAVPEVAEASARAGHVVVTGVVAECCVLSTVEALIDAGCHVIYLDDAVAGQTPELEQMVRQIISGFSPVHTQVMSTREYLDGLL